jgi:hypothetical protein
MMWQRMAVAAFGAMACSGDGDPGTTDTGEGVVFGPARMEVTVSGGVFPEPVTFEITDEAQRVTVFEDYFSVLFFTEDPVVGSDGTSQIDSLTFTVDSNSAPGTYEVPDFDFQYNLSGVVPKGGTLSVADEDEPGSVTITTRAEGRIEGTFSSSARATQLGYEDGLYTVEGHFHYDFDDSFLEGR